MYGNKYSMLRSLSHMTIRTACTTALSDANDHFDALIVKQLSALNIAAWEDLPRDA